MVPEVAHRGHARAQVLLLGGGDHPLEFLGGQLRDLVERAGPAVAAEVDVGVDQAGEERGTGEVGDVAAGGRGRGCRLDADDLPALDQDECAAGESAGPSNARSARYPRICWPRFGGRSMRAG